MPGQHRVAGKSCTDSCGYHTAQVVTAGNWVLRCVPDSLPGCASTDGGGAALFAVLGLAMLGLRTKC